MSHRPSVSARIHIRRNLIGYLALFVALSGTAWAAQKITSKEIRKNAVRAKHIKRAQVKNPKLADGAVTSPKVADGSLLAQDFAADQLPEGALGPKGDTGAQGPPGADGAQGPPGADGTGGPIISGLNSSTTNLPASTSTAVLGSSAVPDGGAGTYVATATVLVQRVSGGGAVQCWLNKNGNVGVLNPVSGAFLENIALEQATNVVTRTIELLAGEMLTLTCFTNAADNAVSVDERSIVAFRVEE